MDDSAEKESNQAQEPNLAETIRHVLLERRPSKRKAHRAKQSRNCRWNATKWLGSSCRVAVLVRTEKLYVQAKLAEDAEHSQHRRINSKAQQKGADPHKPQTTPSRSSTSSESGDSAQTEGQGKRRRVTLLEQTAENKRTEI